MTQEVVKELAGAPDMVLICGRYEGVDERVSLGLCTDELSLGDYVLSGGELPAIVVADAIVRLLPGVLGDGESALTDSYQDALLGAPVYTRPATFRDLDVPAVLRSGDQKRIAEWREERRLEKTQERRPDLLRDFKLTT